MLQPILSPNLRNSFKGLIISVCLILSWIVVYMMDGTHHAGPHLFYIPIILSAWYWHRIGALVVATLSSLLCGPLMYLDVDTHSLQPFSVWGIRAVFFIGMGLLLGYLFERLMEQYQKSQEVGTQFIKSLAHTIELRDPYTEGHCQRVAEVSVEIGRSLGLSETQLTHLYWSALIHDIGKIAIPEGILNKQDRLTDEEFSIVKKHPEWGVQTLHNSEIAGLVQDGVGTHHERWDGTGYPRGLSGKDIPLQGRIIAVSDVWDALTSDRAYRDALSADDSIDAMKSGRGTHFDPEILDIFLRLLETKR